MSLNLLTLPLSGRQVIEASAGTGKTFTLAALYVQIRWQNRHSSIGDQIHRVHTTAACISVSSIAGDESEIIVIACEIHSICKGCTNHFLYVGQLIAIR